MDGDRYVMGISPPDLYTYSPQHAHQLSLGRGIFRDDKDAPTLKYYNPRHLKNGVMIGKGSISCIYKCDTVFGYKIIVKVPSQPYRQQRVLVREADFVSTFENAPYIRGVLGLIDFDVSSFRRFIEKSQIPPPREHIDEWRKVHGDTVVKCIVLPLWETSLDLFLRHVERSERNRKGSVFVIDTAHTIFIAMYSMSCACKRLKSSKRVHSDISPGNILVNCEEKDGRVKITEFALTDFNLLHEHGHIPARDLFIQRREREHLSNDSVFTEFTDVYSIGFCLKRMTNVLTDDKFKPFLCAMIEAMTADSDIDRPSLEECIAFAMTGLRLEGACC